MASVIGLGFVGSAVFKSFGIKKVFPLYGYDKYKEGGIGSLEECLRTPLIFLCLPTLYDHDGKEYDKSAINETLLNLSTYNYNGIIILKSTVESGTTDKLSERFPTLSIMHNPEFLSAKTAFHDFHHQEHIVIGKGKNCTQEQTQYLQDFYQEIFLNAEISVCTALESEAMKSFVNCFYSVKIQFFNELYLLCKQQNADFNTVKNLMLKNGWINPHHTDVPGHDGNLSYGGACFPKDTSALLQHMKRMNTPHAVLEGCVRERNVMRDDCELNEKINSNKISGNGKIEEKLYEEFLNGHVINGINGRVMNGHYAS